MHPDLGGDNETAAMLNEAYATLTDPANRSAYDRLRQDSGKSDTAGKSSAPGAGRRQPVPLQRCAFCGTTSEDVRPDASCTSCHSPLFMAEQSGMEDSDRRTSARVVSDHPMIFCTHWPQREPYSSRAVDVSLSGMKFNSNTSLGLGQIIKVDSQILRAVARVVHSQQRHTDWEIGIQFISLCFMQSRGSFVEHRA